MRGSPARCLDFVRLILVPSAWCRSFADSKTLTEAKREDMFAEIAAHEHMASFTDVLTAQQLSARMLSR